MCAKEKNSDPNYILSLVTCKCPRCRRGDMFEKKSAWQKGFLKMPENCAVCGQPMQIEPGFYYGTGYVSYAVTVALSVASFIAWWVLIGFSLDDNSIFWWLGANTLMLVVSQRWLMRLSRVIWLSFFVRYNSNWKTEPVVLPERLNRRISSMN